MSFFLSFIFLPADLSFGGREKADARKGGLRTVAVSVTEKDNFAVDCYIMMFR